MFTRFLILYNADVTARELYDRDFFEWTQCNAALLRAGRFDRADIEHIAEELEDMGKRDQRELESRLQVLLAHLLKWKYQPAKRSSSWEGTIDTQRDEIERLLRQAPSLKHSLPNVLEEIHKKAVRNAAKETQIAPSVFPEACPFTIEQILDEEFLPQ